jgi:hypothetical protein
MRMVRRREAAECSDFSNFATSFHRDTGQQRKNRKQGFGLCVCGESFYSSTLSSSFLRPQSAAACTKARTTGCGVFSVEDNCGWKSVATKKR